MSDDNQKQMPEFDPTKPKVSRAFTTEGRLWELMKPWPDPLGRASAQDPVPAGQVQYDFVDCVIIAIIDQLADEDYPRVEVFGAALEGGEFKKSGKAVRAVIPAERVAYIELIDDDVNQLAYLADLLEDVPEEEEKKSAGGSSWGGGAEAQS